MRSSLNGFRTMLEISLPTLNPNFSVTPEVSCKLTLCQELLQGKSKGVHGGTFVHCNESHQSWKKCSADCREALQRVGGAELHIMKWAAGKTAVKLSQFPNHLHSNAAHSCFSLTLYKWWSFHKSNKFLKPHTRQVFSLKKKGKKSLHCPHT